MVCGLSGGVDSSVAAALIHEAIGDQLTCIFVDTGLMRLGEAEEVVRLFRGHYNIPLVHGDAGELFLGKLAGVTDPEQKRKIIGATFIDVFDEEAHKIGGVDFLAQGTLYPDVIESVGATGGPERHDQEPPQCRRPAGAHEAQAGRAAARALQGRGARARPRTGPARAFRRAPPVPRPGPGDPHPRRGDRASKLDILRRADAILLDEIRKAGLYDDIWQAFAVLLPVKTVGVMGDARTYENVCALRAVTSTDGMTADYYPFPHESSAAPPPASSTRCAASTASSTT